MNLFSNDPKTKKDMNRQIYHISNFLAIKFTYQLKLSFIFLFILIHLFGDSRSSSVYVLFCLCIFPFFFSNLIQKKEEQTQPVLPLLSKKHNYSSTKELVRSISFLAETFVLLLWQFGNIRSPYSDSYSQYFPFTLLIGSIAIRILLTVIYYLKLRNTLLNNQ